MGLTKESNEIHGSMSYVGYLQEEFPDISSSQYKALRQEW